MVCKEDQMITIKYLKQDLKAVAYDGDKIVGEVTYYLETPVLWNIDHTYVDTHYRGQSIASKLVNQIIEQAKKDNIKVKASCSYAQKVLGQTR